jgi:F-type H+-transporting ATPase subunit a
MLCAVAGATLFFALAMRSQAVVPGRWQLFAEKLYGMIADMVSNVAGEKAKPFFPFIFSIFLFILFANMLGMIPHSLTVTSHIVVNLALALLVFAVIVTTGFVKNGLHFFELFAPKGAPAVIMPFLVVIEIISFLIRPFSLAIRLFANMLAGHILLKVFAGLAAGMIGAEAVGIHTGLGLLPLALNVAITGFEFFVAFLQAFIFSILISVYLRDALELH